MYISGVFKSNKLACSAERITARRCAELNQEDIIFRGSSAIWRFYVQYYCAYVCCHLPTINRLSIGRGRFVRGLFVLYGGFPASERPKVFR